MNEIVKKLLLTNDKFISERHLIQLVFNVRKTFKTTRIYFKQCLWDKKKKKRKKKKKNKKKLRKQDIQNISMYLSKHQNKQDKFCFQCDIS